MKYLLPVFALLYFLGLSVDLLAERNQKDLFGISGGPFYLISQQDPYCQTPYCSLWVARNYFKLYEVLSDAISKSAEKGVVEDRWKKELLIFSLLEDGLCESALMFLEDEVDVDDKDSHFYTRMVRARIFDCIGNKEKALNQLDLMTRMVDMHDPWQQFYLHETKAIFYRSGSMYDKMESSVRSALDWAREIGQPYIQMSTYYKLGFVLAELRDPAEAIKYLQKGRQIAKEMESPHQLWRFYACEGICRVQKDDFQGGVELLEYAGEIGNEYGIMFCGSNFAFLAKGLYMTGRKEEGLEEAEYVWASVKDSDDIRDRRNVLHALYDIYKADGQFEKALAVGENLTKHREALFAQEYSGLVAELETRFRMRENELILVERDQELAMEKAHSASIRAWIWTGFGLSLLLLGLAGVFYYYFVQRKKIAAELSQKNLELKALDESKTRFFEDLSHEFRTPLSLIIGHLNELVEKDNRPQVERRLKIALRNSDRLKELITQILDISCIEAGRLGLKTKFVDPSRWFQQKVEAFDSLVLAKGGKMEIDLGFPEGIEIAIDTDKMEKILNNLLHNAVKYIGSGDEIQVAAGLKQSEKGTTELEFSVTDSGPGISEEVAGKLFERKVKGALPSGGQAGYGIGLALSAELARVMDGSIELDHNYHNGSRFIVKIPVQCISTEKAASMTPVSAGSLQLRERTGKLVSVENPHTVLIVEDHLETANYLEEILGKKYRTICVSNANDAMIVLKEREVDLLLTDVQMPGKNGYELTRDVRMSNTTYKGIPVVLLSATVSEKAKIKGLDCGADDFLAKPIEKKHLLSRIDNLIQKSKEGSKIGAVSTGAGAVGYEVETLRKAESVILDNLAQENFTVNGLALQCGVSKRSLERLFKKHFNKTPAAFIKEKRLEAAWHLLEEQRCNSIARVREIVGINNPSYFSRAFKAKYGCSPSEMLSGKPSHADA